MGTRAAACMMLLHLGTAIATNTNATSPHNGTDMVLCFGDTSSGNCPPCETLEDCRPFYTPVQFQRITCGIGSTIAENGTTSGCACYSFFGFGSDAVSCDPLDPVNSLNTALFLTAGLVALAECVLSAHINIVFAKAGKWKIASANVQTVFLGALTAFCLACWALGYAFTSVGVDQELVFERSLKAPFIGGTSAFGTIAIMTVSLAWMDLALKGKKMSSKTSSTMKTAQSGVRIGAAIFALVEIVLMVVNHTALAGTLSMFVMVLIIPSYAIGARRVAAVMTNDGKTTKGKIYEAATRVLKASNGIVCSLSVYVLFAAGYVTAAGDGRHSVESHVAVNIRINICLWGMQMCIEVAMAFLIMYIRGGQKKLFGKKGAVGDSEMSVTSTATSSS